MLKLTQGLAFALVVFLTGIGLGTNAASAMPPLEQMLEEKIMGDPNAPVTIIEYASLGCPHCRSFHQETLPRIKEKYIDTGKVKLIYRDFPLGQRALAASMVARCSGPVRYFAMIEILFRDQAEWSRAQDAFAALQVTAKKGGMSSKQVDECIRNEPLLQGIRKLSEDAQKNHGVQATPTFLVQGEKVEGALPFYAFDHMIKRALK